MRSTTGVGACCLALCLLFLGGCETMQVPLSKHERTAGLCQNDSSTEERLARLRVGMCENEVFEILGISHETPNLADLDTTNIFEHVSLLTDRNVTTNACRTKHDAEVQYVGHRVPCLQLKKSGYLHGIKWVQYVVGEDSHIDLLFKRGAFISFARGGVKNKDSKDSAYPWEGVLSNPYDEIGDTIRY